MLEFSGQALSCFRGGRMVFSNLSFVLESGGALVLRGPNGSGKSSLLRIMAGLLHPIKGYVRWSDINSSIHNDPALHYCRTHYIGHTQAIKPLMTVSENIAFWGKLRT